MPSLWQWFLIYITVHTIVHAEEKLKENKDKNKNEIVEIPDSCSDVADGLRYIQPFSSGPALPVVCNNGFAVLDASLSLDSYKNYFSSFTFSRQTGGLSHRQISVLSEFDCDPKVTQTKKAIIGLPELEDFSNWDEWWLPAANNIANNEIKNSNSNDHEEYMFKTSLDCINCDSNENKSLGLYVTSHHFCSAASKFNLCSMVNEYPDFDFFCQQCLDEATQRDAKSENVSYDWSGCYAIELDSNRYISSEHLRCVTKETMVRPGIDVNGNKCTCYGKKKNDASDNDKISNTKYYSVNVNDLPYVNILSNHEKHLQLDMDQIIKDKLIIYSDTTTGLVFLCFLVFFIFIFYFFVFRFMF